MKLMQLRQLLKQFFLIRGRRFLAGDPRGFDGGTFNGAKIKVLTKI
jgi:hypothetical protein